MPERTTESADGRDFLCFVAAIRKRSRDGMQLTRLYLVPYFFGDGTTFCQPKECVDMLKRPPTEWDWYDVMRRCSQNTGTLWKDPTEPVETQGIADKDELVTCAYPVKVLATTFFDLANLNDMLRASSFSEVTDLLHELTQIWAKEDERPDDGYRAINDLLLGIVNASIPALVPYGTAEVSFVQGIE